MDYLILNFHCRTVKFSRVPLVIIIMMDSYDAPDYVPVNKMLNKANLSKKQIK